MRLRFFTLLFFLLTCFLSVSAQEAGSRVKTFEKDGLKFDYPADWIIIDKSTNDTQHLLLSKEKTIALITLISPRAFVQSYTQFRELQTNTFDAYVAAMSKTLGSKNAPAQQEFFCIDFNGGKVTGTKLAGFYNNEPSKGEVYPLVVGRRFIAAAYIRLDKEAEKTDVVWQELVKSLSLEAERRRKSDEEFVAPDDITNGGILNSRAVKLARPSYSKAYRDAGAYGEVRVKVVIDETGKVISARAISGHRMLYGEAESAAKKSKFTPTLKCGKPVQVTGVIVYNFSL